MIIEILKNAEEVSHRAYQEVQKLVSANPNAVLGLATGSTPIGLYQLMVEGCKGQGAVSYSGVTTVNLDEYVGLGSQHEQSYRYFMQNNLFDGLDIDLDNTHLPYGLADDLEQECQRYNQLLSDIKVDLQILGIGSNGHIAFNEPNTPFDSRTHVVQLMDSTILDNSRMFDSIEDVPGQAITMGLDSIMQSQYIVVMALGANKAKAVYDMVCGQVSESCPASILQRHANVLLLCDQSAGALIQDCVAKSA